MRICLNLLAATGGGQLTRARAFLERFPRYAPDAELILLKERRVLGEYSSGPGRTVIDVAMGRGPLKAARRMLWENLAVPLIQKRHGCDLYLTFSHYLPRSFPQSVPSVVGISNLAPFSVRARDAEALLGRLRLDLLRHSIISSARRADRVIALSESCRNVLVAHRIDVRKIAVIPNGVDHPPVTPSSGDEVFREHHIARPYLLYVSHFYRYKNHLGLIKAFAALPQNLRTSYQLVLVGAPYDRGYFERVLALRERKGLSDSVVVIAGEHGARLQALYRRTVLFVFPSLVENSPNSLLEALSFGVPVVASNLPPMPEFGGSAARYFDADEVDDMAATMSSVLDDPGELAAMRLRSRARSELFSWDRFVGRVLDECRGAVGKRVASGHGITE